MNPWLEPERVDDRIWDYIDSWQEKNISKLEEITMNNGISNIRDIKELEEKKGTEFMESIKEILNDWEKAKEIVYPILVNYEWNQESPNFMIRRFDDLAVMFYLRFDEETTAKLSKDWIKANGIDVAELFETAMENMRKDTGEPLEDFLGMPILTNRERKFGAAEILDWKVRQNIYNKFGEVYLVPSSIHEWILMPAKDVSSEDLNRMVKEVNKAKVDEREWLSDHVYKLEESGALIPCK